MDLEKDILEFGRSGLESDVLRHNAHPQKKIGRRSKCDHYPLS